MNIDKAISIKTGGETFVDWHELKPFQGKLKSITTEKFNDLKESLKKNGLPKGFDIWIDNKGVKWVHDGHHRLLAFKSLEDEGWFIPPIPCNIVHAKNKKEAAQMLLISNSTYAHISQESLSDFMIENELSVPDLEFLDLPDLDMSQFDLEQKEIKDSQKELDLNSFDNFENKCPKCGFEWDNSESEKNNNE